MHPRILPSLDLRNRNPPESTPEVIISKLTKDFLDNSLLQQLIGEGVDEVLHLWVQFQGPRNSRAALHQGSEALDEALAAVVVHEDGNQPASQPRVLGQLWRSRQSM